MSLFSLYKVMIYVIKMDMTTGLLTSNGLKCNAIVMSLIFNFINSIKILSSVKSVIVEQRNR